MSKYIGTISRGIKTPIIQEGDDIVKIVVDSVVEASENSGFDLNDRDIVGITEAVIARAQGNYITTEQLAVDIKNKFPGGEIGLIFPITSRNRFAVCLKGIAMGVKKITLMLSYPSDEVGNRLVPHEKLEKSNVNPYSDVLNEKQFREAFGYNKHFFTGVDYVEYYKNVIQEAGAEAEIIFANNPAAILQYNKNVLCADIHTRKRTKQCLLNNGAKTVYTLDELMNKPINGSGYNAEYGILGSNLSTEDKLKLFPINCEKIVKDIQSSFKEKTGKNIEVMIYGDGALKDPVEHIWELADPVVSPAYTEGLEGVPNEIKIKYLADNDFSNLSGEELKNAITDRIKNKSSNLKGDRTSLGTTPRKLTDLLGSLCDLTSGSGDKGTPVVLIQGYFDNYAT